MHPKQVSNKDKRKASNQTSSQSEGTCSKKTMLASLKIKMDACNVVEPSRFGFADGRPPGSDTVTRSSSCSALFLALPPIINSTLAFNNAICKPDVKEPKI